VWSNEPPGDLKGALEESLHSRNVCEVCVVTCDVQQSENHPIITSRLRARDYESIKSTRNSCRMGGIQVPEKQLNGGAKQGGNTLSTRAMQIRSCDVQQINLFEMERERNDGRSLA
jgi:hypothetical protein